MFLFFSDISKTRKIFTCTINDVIEGSFTLAEMKNLWISYNLKHIINL